MDIRKATKNDLNTIMDIYSSAREFMRLNGNETQWGSTYPPLKLVEECIDEKMYVCTENGAIVCVFYFAIENDSSYNQIFNGTWLNDKPYGVVHRIASTRTVKGAARFCLNWALEQCNNLKIDTHENNLPMQKLLESLGFKYCGIIHCDHTGDERLAYQKEGV